MTRLAPNEPRTVRHLALTKVRVNLGAVIKRVRINKEYIILEKDGLPVAGLMDIDEFEDFLDLHDPGIKRHIAASVRESRAGKTRPADDLLAELRAADARERRPLRKTRKHTRV